jgi:hypothetical protein
MFLGMKQKRGGWGGWLLPIFYTRRVERGEDKADSESSLRTRRFNVIDNTTNTQSRSFTHSSPSSLSKHNRNHSKQETLSKSISDVTSTVTSP